MLTFQGRYELAQDLSSDDDSTNLTLFKSLINIGRKKVEKRLGTYNKIKSTTYTIYTDAISGTSNQAYRLPRGFTGFSDFYVTVGTTQYQATLVQDPDWWRKINSTTTQSTSPFV